MLAGNIPVFNRAAGVFITPAMALGNDSYTVSLLHLDGTMRDKAIGHPNRQWSFLNGSSILNTAALGPFSQCGRFDGGTAIQTPHTADILPAGDFTIDFWVYLNSFTAVGDIVSKRLSGNTAGPFIFLQNQALVTFYATSQGGPNWDIASGLTVYNFGSTPQWVHCAVTRQGSTWRLYANGTQVQTWTNGAQLMQTTDTLKLGGVSGASPAFMNGYIDEFRFTNGLARWSGTFSPVQRPYFGPLGTGGNDDATVCLLRFEQNYLDSAAGAEVKTVWGGVQSAYISGADKKFGNSCVNMNTNANDAVNALNPVTRYFDFGNHEWTIDFWYKRLSAIGTSHVALGHRDTPSSYGPWVITVNTDGTMNFYASLDNASWGAANGVGMGQADLNTWVHFAIQHSPGVLWTFRNGVLVNSVVHNGMMNSTGPVVLGSEGASAGTLNGLLDEFRLSHIGRYSSSGFTPPAAPYGPDLDVSTVLLLHAEDFTDSSQYNFPIVSNGVTIATIAGAQKFGAGGFGGFANALSNRLSCTYSQPFIPSGAWSIDFWVANSDNTGVQGLVGKSNASNFGPFVIVINAGRYQFYSSTNGTSWDAVNALDIGPATSNVWTHLCVSWDGTTWRAFKDGVLQGSVASSGLPYRSSDAITFGNYQNASAFANPLKGFLDEIRIVNGKAITANFTPPTAPYTA